MKPRHIFFALTLFSTFLCKAQQETNRPTAASGLQIETRTDEERIQLLLDLSQVYFQDGNYEECILALERILEIDPEHDQARYMLSHYYINAKDYPKAEALIKRLIEENPEDYQLLNNLAWLYATAEDPEFRDGRKAIEFAQKAMVLAPNDHHVWSTLSEAYYINGDYEKAYRAITHMAYLASKYGKNITKEMVDGYNEQIKKCKRAWDTQKMLEENDAPEQE